LSLRQDDDVDNDDDNGTVTAVVATVTTIDDDDDDDEDDDDGAERSHFSLSTLAANSFNSYNISINNCHHYLTIIISS